MNNPSLSQRNPHFSGTLDLSAGLGYGLIYQPIIGASSSPEFPYPKQFFSYHRRKLHRRIGEMRLSKLAE